MSTLNDTIIAGLIDQARVSQETRSQEHARKVEELIAATRAKVLEALGENWTALAEHFQEEPPVVKDDGKRVDLTWHLRGGKTYELQLAPIEVKASSSSNYYGSDYNKILVWNNKGCTWSDFPFSDLPAVLYKARALFPAYKKEVEEQYIQNRAPLLEWWRNHDESEARKAYDELVAGLPELKERWEGLLKNWEANREADRLQEEKDKRFAREHEALKESYRSAYQKYLEALEEANSHNARTLELLQTLLDVPFDAWQLTYAIHARDEYGDPQVETRTVWLSQPEPEDGQYLCLDGRQVVYYNPVSLEKSTFKPSDQLEGSYSKIKVYGFPLYISAGEDTARVNALIEAADFHPLPQTPEIPEGLDTWEAERIRTNLRDTDTYEVPF